MDRNVKVSVRTLLVAGAVALALLAAYLIGRSGPAPASADAPDGASTVTVTGVGHVSVVPDQLGFHLSIDLTRPDLAAALDESNATVQQVVDTLTAAGVAERDVQTTDLSINPQYTGRRGQPTVLKGYRVSQTVSVVVKDLAKASDVVTGAVTAGGPGVRLDGLQLQAGDPEAALGPARAEALEQARAKAEEYAADAGRDVGEIVTISESGAATYDEPTAYAASDMASSSIPLQAGQQELSASVQVVFELT